MRCGWTEQEIATELTSRLDDCHDEQSRTVLREIAAEAKAKGHSWPLRPKFVERPPLYIGHGAIKH